MSSLDLGADADGALPQQLQTELGIGESSESVKRRVEGRGGGGGREEEGGKRRVEGVKSLLPLSGGLGRRIYSPLLESLYLIIPSVHTTNSFSFSLYIYIK